MTRSRRRAEGGARPSGAATCACTLRRLTTREIQIKYFNCYPKYSTLTNTLERQQNAHLFGVSNLQRSLLTMWRCADVSMSLLSIGAIDTSISLARRVRPRRCAGAARRAYSLLGGNTFYISRGIRVAEFSAGGAGGRRGRGNEREMSFPPAPRAPQWPRAVDATAVALNAILRMETGI
ncbi:hypothetical protein EVAR_64348_1 [Eumeta japonica]|uniref:Uncharacterized protein n=1 Tax=Eumeta variegata TaxID=151549 RepID=A0A4C1ZME0_EUMVA|nr:hypothetical protein EVAR_64348_1 [Eumeta japonica]